MEVRSRADMLSRLRGRMDSALGAALVQAYRNSRNGALSLKQQLLLSAATASLASGPILIARGW